jgi:hypothetical protein
VLCQFDERTWQADLAPLQKSQLLASLGWTNVITALGKRYLSVNPDLALIVAQHANAQSGKTFGRFAGGFETPCLFESNENSELKAPPATATNSVIRALYEAELAIRSTPTADPYIVQQIENILMSKEAPKLEISAWSPQYYAGLAAKARLRMGDIQKARDILQRGLELAPRSEYLLFLERVMAREGLLAKTRDPANLASAQQVN